MKHIHSVYDTDSHFSISPITRAIKNESSKKTTVMQYDHNSERFTFEMPREIEGHDMTLCNKVELHYINVASDNSGQSKGVYVIDDLQTSPEDKSIVICSWLISKKATKYAGTLSFRLRFACIDENAKVTYAWHTEIFKGVTVSNGIDNADDVHEEYSDILEAWKQEIFASIDDAMSNLVGYDEKLEEMSSDIANLEALHNDFIHTVYPTDEQRAKRDMRGWYRIAETTKSGYWSNIFHVQAQVLRSASTSDAIFTAERMSYQSDPSIGILSFASQRGQYDAIDKLRVVYLKNDSTQKSYLEVHINRNATPADAWDGTGTSTGYKFISETHFKGQYNWSLIEPILVSSEMEDGWTAYEISPLESAWNKVGDSLIDSVGDISNHISNLATEINNLGQTLHSTKLIVDATCPTKKLDLIGTDDYNKDYLKTIVGNALSYDIECLYDSDEYSFSDIVSNTQLPEEFWKNTTFNIKMIPDSIGAKSGNITSISAVAVAEGYAIKELSASRGYVNYSYIDQYSDGEWVYSHYFYFTPYITLTVVTPNKRTITETVSPGYVGSPDSYCFLNAYALLPKNDATNDLFSSTYDLRTQSIDNQLAAGIQELIAKREAAKTSNEET